MDLLLILIYASVCVGIFKAFKIPLNKMMATKLPLRPSMVFIPQQPRRIAASFWQNSIQRMEPGAEAEVIFDAVPGVVFK